MKFYELPQAVEAAIKNTDVRPFVRVLFELADGDVFIPDSDILEFVSTSYKSSDGGIVNSGELVLNNKNALYSAEVNAEYTTGNTGDGNAFSILPPYISVYMWKRTA